MSHLFQNMEDYRNACKSLLPDEVLNQIFFKFDEIDKKNKLGFFEREIPLALAQSKDGVSRVSHIVKAMKDFLLNNVSI